MCAVVAQLVEHLHGKVFAHNQSNLVVNPELRLKSYSCDRDKTVPLKADERLTRVATSCGERYSLVLINT